ncbi:hypothetical protein F6P74_04105 [Streptococcus suis]|nr:hypothetical protein DF184_08990 [Streptococcus suis]MBS8056255.1 hypothetical protein [Streptococcus suis]MBS8070719.1 hypothetical protein [Streptococcus suis]MBS8094554.1 hypothetical protein [Streptococcus suis]MBS8103398.1 hypothetical protein [Streptococcus suis]
MLGGGLLLGSFYKRRKKENGETE